MQLLATGLRNNAHLAAGRTAVFSGVVRGQNLHFLHGVEVGGQLDPGFLAEERAGVLAEERRIGAVERADALRVTALREVNRGGQWVEAPVQAATIQKLEDIILTKARDLRRASITK